MEDGREQLHERIEQLADRLRRVEQRLATLETSIPAAPSPESPPTQTTVPEVAAARSHTAETLPLVGRTLLVLAGAFALRALTEMGTLPQTGGAALGFVYGMLWIVLADRAASRGSRASAVFHGLVGVIIAYPLVWEATANFGFLSERTSAGAMVVATVVGLAVTARHDLRVLAWIVAAAAAVIALALAVATKALALFAVVVLLLATALLWLGYSRGWPVLGWAGAVLADGFMLVLVLIVLRGHEERVAELLRPGAVVALLLGLAVAYLGSFVTRTLAWGRDVGIGEIVQGTAVLAIGLGGAVAVTRSIGGAALAVDLVSLAVAAACYAASFVVLDRRGRRGNFVFYTSVALVCTLVALVALLEGPWLIVALAAAALVAAWLGSIRERATLSLHGAVYLIAAGVVSGLFVSVVEAFTGPTVPPRDWLDLPLLAVILAAVLYCALRVASHGRTWGRFSDAPKVIVLIVLAMGLGGMAVTLIAPILPVSDDAPMPAALAALRTAALSLAAVLLALASHWPRLREAEWLVYPVLIAGGAKLVFEDVRTGVAGGLLLSFGLYGMALMLVARSARRSSTGAAGSSR